MSDPRGQQDPENQLRPLRATAARLGWEWEEVTFRQSRWDDESAAEVRAEIMARLETGEFDILAAWSWDRLSRRGIEEAFSFLNELERHRGVHLYLSQEPFLSTATATAEVRDLMLSLTAWSAKRESARRSERVRARVESKKAASAKLGQRATWGRGRIATPTEAEAARDAWRAGASIRTIAAQLGIPKSQVGRLVEGVPRLSQSSPLHRAGDQAGEP